MLSCHPSPDLPALHSFPRVSAAQELRLDACQLAVWWPQPSDRAPPVPLHEHVCLPHHRPRRQADVRGVWNRVRQPLNLPPCTHTHTHYHHPHIHTFKQFVIIEGGCGKRVPTVRNNSEKLVKQGAELIRINLDYPTNPSNPAKTVSLEMQVLTALEGIGMAIRRLRALD